MIEIRGLTKIYADGHVALGGVDLDVGDGMFGLLGPNGAGKTTFLSILVLAREPTSGRRIYDGLDASRPGNRPAIRGTIGFLYKIILLLRSKQNEISGSYLFNGKTGKESRLIVL